MIWVAMVGGGGETNSYTPLHTPHHKSEPPLQYYVAYILMFHVLEVSKLSVAPLGMDICLEGSGQLLQSHTYIVACI